MQSVDRVLQRLARAEFRDLGCLDVDRVTGAGIAAGTSLPLAGAERAETHERDRVALLQSAADRFERRIQRASCGGFGQVRRLGDRVDQFLFVHQVPLALVRIRKKIVFVPVSSTPAGRTGAQPGSDRIVTVFRDGVAPSMCNPRSLSSAGPVRAARCRDTDQRSTTKDALYRRPRGVSSRRPAPPAAPGTQAPGAADIAVVSASGQACSPFHRPERATRLALQPPLPRPAPAEAREHARAQAPGPRRST